MEHAKKVFHTNAMRLVTDALSNARVQVTNDYLKKFRGQEVASFRANSSTYLTEEEYTKVKQISVHFVIRFFCYYWFNRLTNVYRSSAHGWKIVERITELFISYGLHLNGSPSQ